MDFRPPDVTFAFSYEQKILIWTPPNVFLKLGFEVSVTVDFAVVFDSKGIREAVEQKKPEKALKSFGIRDTIDGVDTPIVTLSITVYAGIEVSGKKPLENHPLCYAFCPKESLCLFDLY